MSHTKHDEKAIEYDARSFVIRGKRELLIGGEFHYFRTPHELWEDRIIKMKRCGCNQVTTYIPWNWHEPVEGRERWTGDQDLAGFLELCTRHGLFVVVKPGPYICAEWDFGGHPDWLLPKHLRLRMLDETYLKYVDGWYRRVAEVIRPFLVTRGGNIIAIQVENEYDHLLWGDHQITVEDAKTYFRRLEEMMDRYGIDIPKFANDASFLRGSNIIETRTYYPSIPWWWRWELEVYDNYLEQSKAGQPEHPAMVLELQSGWFSMFGHQPFVPDRLLTEAVTNSTLALGASYLNLYMFCGGTTFPFWGCRGDIYDVLPIGTGVTTSYDFGGSPIREWGELYPERYDWMRIFNHFAQDFKDLLLNSDNVNDVKVVAGGEEVALLGNGQVVQDAGLTSSSERIRVITRKADDQRLVMVRNMGDHNQVLDLARSDTGEVMFRKLQLPAHESCILPVGVQIPGTDITIVRSTSSLQFLGSMDDQVVFGLFGKPGRLGETVLNVPSLQVEVLYGDVHVAIGEQSVLSYTHEGIHVVRVKGHLLVIMDQDLAGKMDKVSGGLLVSDTYFVRDIVRANHTLSLATEMRNNTKNRFFYLGSGKVARVCVAGQTVKIHRGAAGLTSFEYTSPAKPFVELEWLGGWKLCADAAETGPAYQDADWSTMEKPESLEDHGVLQHGHVWYRMQLVLPEDATGVNISIPGNGIDYFSVFINGHAVWAGIAAEAKQGIQQHIKPGKNSVAVLYENFYHTKSHPHEGVIQKYSGISGPVVVTGTVKGKPFVRSIETFKVRDQLEGMRRGYTMPEFDDSGWVSVPASRKYVMTPELSPVVWMRRKFRYRCEKGCGAAVKLTIPEAKTRLLLYLNGMALGQFEQAGPQHDFYIPESFLQKENVLAIIWEGYRGCGDYTKGFLLEPVLGTFFEVRDVGVEIVFQDQKNR